MSQQEKYIPLVFHWDKVWLDYLADHDIPELLSNLAQGMDKVSIEYIVRFTQLIKLLPFKDVMALKESFCWTQKDFECYQKYKEYDNEKNYEDNEAFIHANHYGLDDIPKERRESINKKAVIDGGGYTGGTAILFNELFPQSDIYVFEPQKTNFITTSDRVKAVLQQKIKENKEIDGNFLVFQKALGDKVEKLDLRTKKGKRDASASFMDKEDGICKETFPELFDTVDITTIDTIADDIRKQSGEIGLIKLDIEGFEKKALEGAVETIARDKPIIIAALYHNPVDFFEIKPMLQKINPDYKFIVRRSEMIIPLGDIILIAY